MYVCMYARDIDIDIDIDIMINLVGPDLDNILSMHKRD